MNAPEELEKRWSGPEFEQGVRKHRAVLDFITDIEDEMRARKIKKSWLAEKLGQSRARISTIFRRKPNLTFFTAVELANALDMDVQVHAVRRGAVVDFSFPAKNTATGGASAAQLRLVAGNPWVEQEEQAA